MGSSVILPAPGQPKTGADPTFKTAAIPNLVSFAFQKVPPPSPIYVQRDDILVAQLQTVLPSVTVSITGRLLQVPFPQAGQPDQPGISEDDALASLPGYIVPFRSDTPLTSAITKGVTLPLSEGYLLSVQANDISGNTLTRGQTYVRIYLVRGGGNVTVTPPYQVLVEDYITTLGSAGWPGGLLRGPTESTGNLVEALPANPAAGADFVFSFNSSTVFRLSSVTATLSTSATVATRVPRLRILDGLGKTVYQAGPTATVPASIVAVCSGTPDNMAVTADTTTIAWSIPPGQTGNGGVFWQLASSTLNLQAADQWSAIAVVYEQWLVG